MYVILRGSVDIRYTRHMGYELINFVINSKYDGQHFGDLSMLSTLYSKFQKIEQEKKMAILKEKELEAKKLNFNNMQDDILTGGKGQ